jgi:APA family basic amino acid/polyamine antiporter
MANEADFGKAAPQRLLGFWMCLALVMGNMIGSGVFLLPASLAPFGWNAVAGWVVTIAGALVLAYLLVRLTKALPKEADTVGIVRASFGAIPGFMIGWSYWVSVWTANVTLAVACVSSFSVFAPGLSTVPFLPALAALTLLWILTLVSLSGARSAGGVQVVTLILKLIPLLVVIVIIALALARTRTAYLAPLPEEGLTLTGVAASATLTLWALLGFESASVVGEKVANPQVTIARATMIGTAVTGLIYLVVCSGIALMLPVEVASASNAPFATFVERYWAREPGLMVAAFAGIAALGALNGFVLLQGEVPLAMVRAQTLPRWFGKTNRRDAPARALILSSVLASILLLANSSKTMGGMFTFMALLSTSASLWLYLAIALAAAKHRIALPWAITGAVYALLAIWGAGIYVSLMSLALMLSGLPLFLLARRSAAPQKPAHQGSVG